MTWIMVTAVALVGVLFGCVFQRGVERLDAALDWLTPDMVAGSVGLVLLVGSGFIHTLNSELMDKMALVLLATSASMFGTIIPSAMAKSGGWKRQHRKASAGIN
ncbi:hypothetical protein [Ottowia sp.]|uniref:hypothetical protein n=1 Tax=Ottowia sp. TaxID=1898956 RepID=UPI0025F3B80F|nr:hypothetical protein [Ottowia sp.]MBK6616104.1 hypothetical protein [Ottowia sp.]